MSLFRSGFRAKTRLSRIPTVHKINFVISYLTFEGVAFLVDSELTLCRQMEFSIQLHTITSDGLLHILRVHMLNFPKIIFSQNIDFVLTKSVDPDEMSHNAIESVKCRLDIKWLKRIPFVMPPPFIMGGHIASPLSVRSYVRPVRPVLYVRKMVSGRYLLKTLVYWIHISYTGT